MIVFDTSTLVLLAKIEMLDAFLENYQKEIIIPRKVYEESCGKSSFDALLIKRRVEEKKIRIKEVKNKETVQKMMNDFNISAGEAEAIALALEQNAELVGIDDKLGINACKLLNLPFTTAIAIIIRLREKNCMDKEKALVVLNKLSYYGRYSGGIILNAKRLIEGD